VTGLDSRKQRAAQWSLIYNVVATIAKAVGAALTGSVSLISEAAHGATDVVSSIVAYASVRASATPPDEEHPYGHGKIETLAGLGEAVLLLAIVIFIGVEAVQRLLHPSPVESLGWGIGIMAASAVTSFVAAAHVGRVGRETESVALQSNGQHLRIDAWTSVGVLIALAVVHFTGWSGADSVCAIIFAAWMGWEAWQLAHRAFHDLIDHRVTDAELARVRAVLDGTPGVIGHHALRTRHSGSMHYVDVHVVVPRHWTVVEAHDLADGIEKRIAEVLHPAEVVVHVDPEPEAGLDAANPPV
jgi:cation diffusion facilitator family transporter